MKDADASEYLKNSLKNSMQQKKNWQLKEDRINEDGSYSLSFISQRTGGPEILTFNISFEKGKGTSLVFFYQWPPCSGEIKEEVGVPTEGQAIKKESPPTPSSPPKEKSLNIGEIPGAKFDFEKRTECSQQLGYIYESYKDQDISNYLKETLKQILLGQGLKLEKERKEGSLYILDFTSKTVEEIEKVILQVGFKQEKGNYFIFDYRWPPCSE